MITPEFWLTVSDMLEIYPEQSEISIAFSQATLALSLREPNLHGLRHLHAELTGTTVKPLRRNHTVLPGTTVIFQTSIRDIPVTIFVDNSDQPIPLFP